MSKAYVVLLLAALMFAGCQQKPFTASAAPKVLTHDEQVLASTVVVLREIAKDTPPETKDWCTVLSWDKRWTDFTWLNQGMLEKAGYRTEVTAEFQRRAKVRNQALRETLQKSPVIPDCHFPDQVYDPVKWVAYAESDDQPVPDALLLKMAKEMVKEPRFQYIRSESWEARVNAINEWRHVIIGGIGIKKHDLPKLGLSTEEIRQIYWNVERGQ